MKRVLVLTTALLISSCSHKKPLVDGCFPPLPEIRSLTLPNHHETTKEQYREAAITRTEELLLARRDYDNARNCVDAFD